MAKVLRRLLAGLMALMVLVLGHTAVSALISPGRLPWLLGHAQVVVISGSMSPSLEVGDLLIIRRQQDYQPGDIITYLDGASLVTHRLVEKAKDGWIARGDANNTADRPISPEQVEGRVVLRVPRAGRLLLWLRGPQGLAVVAALIVALTALSYMKERQRKA